MKRITSRQNPLVSRFKSVARGDVSDWLLLDGAHLVAEALESTVRVSHAFIASGALARPEVAGLAAGLERHGAEVLIGPPAVLEAVSPVRTPSSVVAIAPRPVGAEDRIYAAALPFVVIACDVQDPGNLGAIIRVAEAGGVTGVVAAGASADPFSWKALRGSMGSALRLPIARCPVAYEAVARSKSAGCRVVATVPVGGRPLYELAFSGPAAVLVGGEGPGLPPALVQAADERVTIPMQAPVESLNAAVAAALVIYEAHRQRVMASAPVERSRRRR